MILQLIVEFDPNSHNGWSKNCMLDHDPTRVVAYPSLPSTRTNLDIPGMSTIVSVQRRKLALVSSAMRCLRVEWVTGVAAWSPKLVPVRWTNKIPISPYKVQDPTKAEKFSSLPSRPFQHPRRSFFRLIPTPASNTTFAPFVVRNTHLR